MAGLSEMIQLATAMQQREATRNVPSGANVALGENLASGSAQFLPGMELGRKHAIEKQNIKLKEAEHMINVAKWIQEQEKAKREAEQAKQEAANNKAILDDFNKKNIQTAISPDMPRGNTNAGKLDTIYYSPAGDNFHKEYEFSGNKATLKIVPNKEKTSGKGSAESATQQRLLAKDIAAEAESMAKMYVVEKIDELMSSGDEDKILRGQYLQNNGASLAITNAFRSAAEKRINGDEIGAKREESIARKQIELAELGIKEKKKIKAEKLRSKNTDILGGIFGKNKKVSDANGELTAEKAQEYLNTYKGDKEAARKQAIKDGYTIPQR
jgi:hypothetical protein